MPTTTKMGIVYPSSTDLVKDGATAMGTISTTVDNKTGMVLIKSATFSAVSAVSLDANTFSATYDFYKLIISGNSSADVGFTGRFRAAGADNSTANYNTTAVYTQNAVNPTRSSSAGVTAFEIGSVGTNGFSAEIRLYYPFSTTYKKVFTASSFGNFAADRTNLLIGGQFNATTSFDSFSFYPNSGTFSGRYEIFGVNQ